MSYQEQMKMILTKNPSIFLEILLEKNKVFQLPPIEILILQHLWLAKTKQDHNLSHHELAECLCIDEQKVRQCVMHLIAENYLHLISTEQDGKIMESYDLAPLVNKCFEADILSVKPTNTLYMFVEKVEHEFSRKLSPIEIQYIQGWIFDQQLSLDFLEEALKETVLSGVRNFKYMNAIINNWQKNAEKAKLTKGYRMRKDPKTVEFSSSDKAIAEFDWDEALNEED